MKNSTLVKIFGLAPLMLASTVAFAADEQGGGFNALDVNQDGQLSVTEASTKTELSEQWTKADKDENGIIDKVEFSAFESDIDQSEKPAGVLESMLEKGEKMLDEGDTQQ